MLTLEKIEFSHSKAEKAEMSLRKGGISKLLLPEILKSLSFSRGGNLTPLANRLICNILAFEKCCLESSLKLDPLYRDNSYFTECTGFGCQVAYFQLSWPKTCLAKIVNLLPKLSVWESCWIYLFCKRLLLKQPIEQTKISQFLWKMVIF